MMPGEVFQVQVGITCAGPTELLMKDSPVLSTTAFKKQTRLMRSGTCPSSNCSHTPATEWPTTTASVMDSATMNCTQRGGFSMHVSYNKQPAGSLQCLRITQGV